MSVINKNVGNFNDIESGTLSVVDTGCIGTTQTDLIQTSCDEPTNNLTISHTGNIDISDGTLLVDTINETTTDNGVVIEGITLENNDIDMQGNILKINDDVIIDDRQENANQTRFIFNGSGLNNDRMSYNHNLRRFDFRLDGSPNPEVRIQNGDTVQIANGLETDSITEFTTDNGVDLEGVNFIDNTVISSWDTDVITAAQFNVSNNGSEVAFTYDEGTDTVTLAGSGGAVDPKLQALDELEVPTVRTSTLNGRSPLLIQTDTADDITISANSGANSIILDGDVDLGNTLTVDTINESTTSAGVTIEGFNISDTLNANIAGDDLTINNIFATGTFVDLADQVRISSQGTEGDLSVDTIRSRSGNGLSDVAVEFYQGGIRLGTSIGGNPTGYSDSPLTFYEEYSESGAGFDGGLAVYPSGQTADVYITRIGNMVTYHQQRIQATSDSTTGASFEKDNQIPVRFRPTIQVESAVRMRSGSTFQTGIVIINTSGQVILFWDQDGTTAYPTSTATTGPFEFSVSYIA